MVSKGLNKKEKCDALPSHMHHMYFFFRLYLFSIKDSYTLLNLWINLCWQFSFVVQMNRKRIREQKYFSLCRAYKKVSDSVDKILLLVINQCPDTWHVMHIRLDKNWRVLRIWLTYFYCVLGEVNFFVESLQVMWLIVYSPDATDSYPAR